MSSDSDSDSWDTASDGGDKDSDFIQRDSDVGEEEDDSGDLSHLGTAATSVKFQTVQQQSYQVAEGGTERLAQQVLHSCELSNQQLAPASGEQTLDESHDNAIASGTTVLQQNIIQVQQQFGDVTVKGTRNLTIGGTQNIGKPGQSQDEIDKVLTDRIKKKTLSKIVDWTKGMVRTSSLEKVLEKLNKGTSWVTIKGSPGEGKSTVAYMALGELHKMGRQVFQVSSPNEFSQVTTTCSQPVIMFDDIFGNLEFDQAKWLMWEEVLHDVLDPTEHRSHEQQSRKSVTVILVGRDYVLNTASCNMGRSADFFMQDEHVVLMSNIVEREIHEKQAIWKSVSDSSGTELDQSTIDKICRIKVPHGFPHVCRLFATIRKNSPKITAEEFFETPLEFLTQTIIRFMHNKLKLNMFKQLIKRDGKVSVRELGKLDSGYETIQTAYDLVGTYLRKEDDYFLFDHPSIYDSVAYNICKLYPLFVIDNCNMSFIHERVRIEPSRDTQHDTPSVESGLVVYIPRSYVGDLAKRFAVEISKLNLLQVFSHKEFRDDVFAKEVMPVLHPLTELITLADCKSRENFLSLLASNKSPQLLKYVDDHIGRQLTQDEINTVLYGVCKYATSDVLSYLSQICETLDINVKLGDENQTPLMMVAQARDTQFIQDILSLNPDVNARDRHGTTAFHYLCKNGLVSAVTQIIDRVTDIDMKDLLGWSPLLYACKRNHTEVVNLLLDKGAAFGGMEVRLACKYGGVGIMCLLFERGATVNMTSDSGNTPLHSACYTGNMEVIKYLKDKGASVNIHDESHWSPLHRACMYNQPQAVQYLLDHGADMESRDSMGDTPLHAAAKMGFEECVDVLLKAGANVNVQTTFGHISLHRAVYSELYSSEPCLNLPDVSVCQTLIRHGSDINKQDPEGNTPLHLLCNVDSDTDICKYILHHPASAFEDVYRTLVTLLIDHGADVNIHNNRGEPALRGWCKTLVRRKKIKTKKTTKHGPV